MKSLPLVGMTVLLAMTCSIADAQFVKGNEAVTTGTAGTKVETPPQPANTLATPCPAARDGCAGAGWKMVETPGGLMECTEIYARAGTCRPSTYGSVKLTRLWVVKTKGQWMLCQYPDVGSKCVSTKALPYPAVQ